MKIKTKHNEYYLLPTDFIIPIDNQIEALFS